MTDELQKTIKEQISQLPKEGQDAIASIDWVKITESIGATYNLDEDEVNNFQLETLLALIGSTDPSLYAVNIENQVGTTTEMAKNISKEVAEKIFAPILEKGESIIKEKINTGGADWQANVDFVLSNGDYSSFLETKEGLQDN